MWRKGLHFRIQTLGLGESFIITKFDCYIFNAKVKCGSYSKNFTFSPPISPHFYQLYYIFCVRLFLKHQLIALANLPLCTVQQLIEQAIAPIHLIKNFTFSAYVSSVPILFVCFPVHWLKSGRCLDFLRKRVIFRHGAKTSIHFCIVSVLLASNLVGQGIHLKCNFNCFN